MQVFQLERRVVREGLARFEPIVAQKTLLRRRLDLQPLLGAQSLIGGGHTTSGCLLTEYVIMAATLATTNDRRSINTAAMAATMGTTATAATAGPPYIDGI